MDTNETIVANPSNYGFEWANEEVSTEGGKVSLGNSPILIVTDVTKFEGHFPGRIAASLNGSSIRVISQGVGRRILAKTARTPVEVIKPQVLAAVLGQRSRAPVTVKVFELPDGTTTSDRAAFMAAWGIEA